MKIKDVMIKKVISVKRATPLRDIMEIFKNFHSFPVLPVVDNENRVVGIITFDDILKVFSPHNIYLSKILRSVTLLEEDQMDLSIVDLPPEAGILFVADDLMNPEFITIDEEELINKAHSLMKMYKRDRIIVVDKEKKLVGIVSLFDIILGIFKEKGICH